MRKTIVISTLFSLFGVAFVVGMIMLAGFGSKAAETGDVAKPDTRYVREDAEKKKKVKTAEGEETTAKYITTDESVKDSPVDIYEDEGQNQYRYNEQGELIAYRAGIKETEISQKTEEESLNKGQNTEPEEKEEAAAESIETSDAKELKLAIEVDPENLPLIKASWEYVCETYGDRVVGFELVEFKENGIGSIDKFDIRFGINFGVGKFIYGPKARVSWDFNGELSSSFCAEYEQLMRDLDRSLVDHITEQQILDKVKEDFGKEHSTIDLDSLQLRSVRMIQTDEGYKIRVPFQYDFEYYDKNLKQQRIHELLEHYDYPLIEFRK